MSEKSNMFSSGRGGIAGACLGQGGGGRPGGPDSFTTDVYEGGGAFSEGRLLLSELVPTMTTHK